VHESFIARDHDAAAQQHAAQKCLKELLYVQSRVLTSLSRPHHPAAIFGVARMAAFGG
jgi:hypothetical protein